MATPAPRFTLALFGTFAAAALLLALVGIYGVVSFITSQRTQEIGIRMALGANRRQVMWMALRQTLLLALVGVAAGLPAGLWCRTAGPGRADSNPAARSMGAHCRHLHSAAAGCRRIVPAGATGGQHQSRSNSARRVARRHWKSLPARINAGLKRPFSYPNPPHSLRVLASRYARINQSSAERPGSVTANAAVSGIELVPGLSPNPELTQKSPFLFMQSDDACWHLHNSIPGKFANVAHYFRPSAHNIFR